jgi:hypothetical protein
MESITAYESEPCRKSMEEDTGGQKLVFLVSTQTLNTLLSCMRIVASEACARQHSAIPKAIQPSSPLQT